MKRIRHIGKKHFKFQFEITVHTCEVVHTAKLAPLPLVVSWTRGARKATTATSFVKLGTVTWEQPLSMVATLYEGGDQQFQPKEYRLALQEDRGKKGRDTLAWCQIDLAEYASIEARSRLKSFRLKSTSKMVRDAQLQVTIACNFLRSGDAQDEDALSALSGMTFMTKDGFALNSKSGESEASDDADFRNDLLEEDLEKSVMAAGGATCEEHSQLIAELTAEIKSMEEDLRLARDHARDVENNAARSKASLTQRIRQLEEEAKIASQASTSTDSAEERLKAQVAEYQSRLRAATNELALLEDDLVKTEDENEELLQKLKAAQAEVESLKERARASPSPSPVIPVIRTTAAGGEGDSAEEVESLRKDLKSAYIQLDEYEKQIKRLERDAPPPAKGKEEEGLAEEVQRLREENEKLKEEAAEATKATDEMVQQLMDAKMASAEAAFVRDEVIADRNDIAKKLAKAKLNYRELAERLTKQEVELVKKKG